MDWAFLVYLISVGINVSSWLQPLSGTVLILSLVIWFFISVILMSKDGTIRPDNIPEMESFRKLIFPKVIICCIVGLTISSLAPTVQQMGFILSTKAIQEASNNPQVIDTTKNAFGLLNDYLGKLRVELKTNDKDAKVPEINTTESK